MPENKIKVMIIDDHPIVRNGIIRLLEDEEDIIVSGESDNANSAITVIEKSEPDVALVDIFLDGQSDGIDLIKAIKERFPKVVCLVLSMHNESVYAERAMKAGAKGYLPKNEAPQNIIDAIKTVKSGKLYLSKSISDKILTNFFYGAGFDDDELHLNKLTDREFEIFQLFGNGLDTIEISKKLNVSKHTIETHRRNIKEKLEIRNNSDLIKTAAQWNLTHKK